jgi:hypothetical protein
MQADLVGISLSVEAGKAAYIPLGHTTGGGDLFGAALARRRPVGPGRNDQGR